MMDEFLRKFPEYEIMPNDPVEFVYLLESYKTSSFYSLNLFFGPTFSNRLVTQSNSTMNVDQTEYNDRTGTGFQVGFGVSRNLWKSVNGNIGVIYSIHNYSYSEKSSILLSSQQQDFEVRDQSAFDLSSEERLTLISIPLTFNYSFGKGNLNYSARIGGSVGFLNHASLTLKREQPVIEPISETFDDITQKRNKNYYSVIFGTGLEYKIPRGFLVLDIRYQLGIENIRVGELYIPERIPSRLLDLDDNFKLNYLSATIGYHFSIYQSKKNRF